MRVSTGFAPLLLATIAATAACRGAPAEETACWCTPGNIAHAKLLDGTQMDGARLLDMLRRHRQDVAEKRTPRDIKVLDDQLRFAVLDYCQPCGDWIQDRLTIEEMFPMQRLDEATDAVCLGLVLRDGKSVYGQARPRACR